MLISEIHSELKVCFYSQIQNGNKQPFPLSLLGCVLVENYWIFISEESDRVVYNVRNTAFLS